MLRSLRNNERVLSNAVLKRLYENEIEHHKALGSDLKIADIIDESANVRHMIGHRSQRPTSLPSCSAAYSKPRSDQLRPHGSIYRAGIDRGILRIYVDENDYKTILKMEIVIDILSATLPISYRG